MLSKVGRTWPESCNLEEIYDLQHYKSWGENINLWFVGHIKKDSPHEGGKRGEKSCAPRGRTFHLPVSLSCFNEEFTHSKEKYTRNMNEIYCQEIGWQDQDPQRGGRKDVLRPHQVSQGVIVWFTFRWWRGTEFVTIGTIFINTCIKLHCQELWVWP